MMALIEFDKIIGNNQAFDGSNSFWKIPLLGGDKGVGKDVHSR